jgi:hypothetical protein
MALFQISYPELLRVVKKKVIISFLILMIFLVTRLYLYLDLKNIHGLFSYPTIYSTIPFYISEIVIALSLALFLRISGKMDQSDRTHSERSDDRTPLISDELYPEVQQTTKHKMENTQGMINDSMHSLLNGSQEPLETTRMLSTKNT